MENGKPKIKFCEPKTKNRFLLRQAVLLLNHECHQITSITSIVM